MAPHSPPHPQSWTSSAYGTSPTLASATSDSMPEVRAEAPEEQPGSETGPVAHVEELGRLRPH